MSATALARRHFEAALAEGAASGYEADALSRAMLGLVVKKYLEYRPVCDVQAELRSAAEYCDPDTDFVFMRP
jgi:hypothetical protein